MSATDNINIVVWHLSDLVTCNTHVKCILNEQLFILNNSVRLTLVLRKPDYKFKNNIIQVIKILSQIFVRYHILLRFKKT